jgi:hypothetical protein
MPRQFATGTDRPGTSSTPRLLLSCEAVLLRSRTTDADKQVAEAGQSSQQPVWSIDNLT